MTPAMRRYRLTARGRAVNLASVKKYMKSAKGRAAIARRLLAITEWLRNRKLELGCVDCGYRTHYAALDFDHRDCTRKVFQIGNRGHRSLAAVQAEAAKCDVRCANCHRIKTAERRNAA